MTADPDLAALWDAHCRCEFETRNIGATMATMVAEPYVNHIPTMTGGVGFDAPHDFYANHFVGVNPPDLELALVSRTVGESSVVDSDCSRARVFPSPAPRPHTRCLTSPCPATP